MCMQVNSRPSMSSLRRAENDPARKHRGFLMESSVDLGPFWRGPCVKAAQGLGG